MLIPVSRTAARPGSSYRVVSPVVSHHHFNARRRPGLGQPATVWLARKRLYNPWDRLAAGLGQLSYEKAKEILMYGPTRGYSDEQMRAANLVVYPARTAEGALVSGARIAAGEFEIETEAAAGERAVVRAGPASLAIPPKPVQARPPLYRDFEDCIPGDQECINRNMARLNANQAIMKNAGMDYMRAKCERACALNTRAGHPEMCRNCAVQFARVPVPAAPGTRRTADQAPLATAPAETPKAAAAVPTAAAEPSPEAEAGDLRDRERLASAERGARAAAGTAATFLMGSWVGGVPNWLLIAGAAATGLVLLGKQR